MDIQIVNKRSIKEIFNSTFIDITNKNSKHFLIITYKYLMRLI